MKKSVYELFFCLTAFAAAPLWGQNAQLSGTITDTSKSVVPQAAVRILSRTNGWDRKTETNNGGIYGFPSLPPGTYDLEISKEGFQTLNRTSIKLDVETHVQLDFTLKVGNTSQTITVTGDTALVQSTDASLGNVITTRRSPSCHFMPVTRSGCSSCSPALPTSEVGLIARSAEP